MTIVKRVVNKRKRVFAVRMNLDQNTDDIWNLYNLMSLGDLITGTCHRKIQRMAGGVKQIEKRTIKCTLRITSFWYDGDSDSIRIQGTNATENQWIGLGLTQGMDVFAPRQITLVKPVFDSMHVRRLDAMGDEEKQGNLVAITMEDGLANIFLVSKNKSLHKAKIEKTVAKNKGAFSKHEKTRNRFFELVLQACIDQFSGDNSAIYKKVTCVVIGSPGFVAENFQNFFRD